MDGRSNNAFNKQQHEAKEARVTKIQEAFINSETGLSVKDVAVDFKLTSDRARSYIRILLDRNVIKMDHKEGKTPIYAIVKDGEPATENNDEALKHSPDGKEFEPDSYIPCTDNCKPGDIIWISSRSGEGEFFRYLIITPWERKAMVLGIILEGHPQLNLNDPYYVYIGDVPENGKHMYADIRNNCQRGYKQFGKRLGHVPKEFFDDVKARLARSMGIERCVDSEVEITRLKGNIDKYRRWLDQKNEDIKNLERVLKNTNDMCVDYKSNLAEAEKRNKELAEENEKLLSENAQLNQDLNESPVIASAVDQTEFDADILTGMIIDSEVKKTKIEMYEEEVKMLRQMIFNMIKGGQA